jgi:hypothetical protein
MERVTLYTIELTAAHRPTGTVRHYADGVLQPPPHSLKIERIGDEFYLLYLDAAGEEQNDTAHQTLDDAFEWAKSEFGIARAEWKKAAGI